MTIHSYAHTYNIYVYTSNNDTNIKKIHASNIKLIYRNYINYYTYNVLQSLSARSPLLEVVYNDQYKQAKSVAPPCICIYRTNIF